MRSGSDDVGILGGVGHDHVVADDELAETVVAQDISGEVDVAVLVGRHVVAVVDHHLDRGGQRVGALDAGVQSRELVPSLMASGQVVRELRRNGVVARGQRVQTEAAVAPRAGREFVEGRPTWPTS